MKPTVLKGKLTIVLLLLLPVLLYKVYPPEIKRAPEASLLAARSLRSITFC